jgi:hypothetical protein
MNLDPSGPFPANYFVTNEDGAKETPFRVKEAHFQAPI